MRQPSPLLWEAFERLARQGAPSGTVGNPSILAAARVCLMDETRSGSGQAESCLKALHSLVAYGHDSLTSLFTSELLELLVSRCANLGVVGPTVRTVLGILGNLASRSEEFCKELSRSPKAEPFAKSLAKSLVWYKDQVSQESTLEVEVHLNYAMASLVMGWLAWGSSEAQQHLEDQLGSTQVLLDILRTFTVFQDRCGTLTDNSLLCVASVMRFLEANGPKSLEVSDVSDKMELKPRPLPRPSTSEVASEPHHQKLRTNCSDGLLDLTPPRPRKEVILKPRESSPNVWTKNVYRPSSGTPDATFGPSMQVYQRRK